MIVLALIVGFLIQLASAWLIGWGGSTLWNWFVPLAWADAPTLSIWLAAGLGLVGRVLTGIDVELPEENGEDLLVNQIVEFILYVNTIVSLVLIGLVIKTFFL